MANDVFDLDELVGEVGKLIERLCEHRDNVSHAARGTQGSQASAKLGKRAADLTVAIRDLEAGELRLRDIVGQGDRPPAAGAPVLGQFEIVVAAGDVVGSRIERLRVWPEKPITAVINEAIVLLGLQEQSGVWGLHRRGEGAPIQEGSVGEARVQSNDVLTLRLQ
jgi:hypothetical protein